MTITDTAPYTLRIITSSAASSAMLTHSSSVIRPPSRTNANTSPSSDGVMYPASPVNTMPGPVGLPTDTVTPDVSEWSLIPVSRRPVRSAARA